MENLEKILEESQNLAKQIIEVSVFVQKKWKRKNRLLNLAIGITILMPFLYLAELYVFLAICGLLLIIILQVVTTIYKETTARIKELNKKINEFQKQKIMKKITDALKKLMGYIISPFKLWNPNAPIHKRKGYKVYVTMKHVDTLMDNNIIEKSIRGKIIGTVYYSICLCEPDMSRTFVLTDHEDFESFATAMKTIPGVLDVIKGESKGQKVLNELETMLTKN